MDTDRTQDANANAAPNRHSRANHPHRTRGNGYNWYYTGRTDRNANANAGGFTLCDPTRNLITNPEPW